MCLDEKLLNFDLGTIDLASQLRITWGNTSCDDWTRDVAGTAECSLIGNKDIRNILRFPRITKRSMTKPVVSDIPFLHRGEEGEAESLVALCLP